MKYKSGWLLFCVFFLQLKKMGWIGFRKTNDLPRAHWDETEFSIDSVSGFFIKFMTNDPSLVGLLFAYY